MALGKQRESYNTLLTPVALHTADGMPVLQDHDTGSMPHIRTTHLMVHEGRSFTTTYTWTAVAAGNTRDLMIRIPADGREAHLVYAVFCDQPCSIVFYEDATIAVAGTALARRNKNRRSINVSDLATFRDCTPGVPLGTALEQMYIPGGEVFKGSVGGETPREEEWILRSGIDYLIRMTNQHGADAAIISMHAHWYEVSS